MRYTPALLAVLLAAVPSRAAEVRDLGTHCTPSEQKKIDKWVADARDWTALAKKRVDEGDSTTKGQLTKLTGQQVFGCKDPAECKRKQDHGETITEAEYQYDPKFVSEKLDAISKILASPEIRCVSKDLSEYYYCNSQGGKVAAWEAFTDMNAKVIWLCPEFLAKTGEKNDLWAAGRIVHEASHAAGVGEMKFESYCTAGFSCDSPCGDGDHAYKTADNWAQFVHCSSDHESNEDAFVITASPRKKKK